MIIVADREGNLRTVDWKDHEIRMQRILRLHYGAGGFALEPTRNSRHALSAGSMGALRNIRGGNTISYAELAGQIGRPTAPRAVGLANAQIQSELLCLVMVSSEPKGSLTGYGGGINRKRWLLEHEGINSTVQNLR
jgi:methylated-DNA-[protein]-cysteine S-methyltransferase